MESQAVQSLADQVLLDRFEVIAEPVGWRCRACNATVHGDADAVSRLAESAADHALFCGRCDD